MPVLLHLWSICITFECNITFVASTHLAQYLCTNIFIFFKTVILEIGLFLVLQVFQADFFKKMNLKPELQVSEAILEKDLQ